MSRISVKDQENLVVLELANRQMRQDLKLALILISNKKQTFNNLDKYEEKKRFIYEQNQQMMVSDLIYLLQIVHINKNLSLFLN